MSNNTDKLTIMLRAAMAGERDALNRVLPLLYRELQAVARRQLRGNGHGRTLTPTALVHEAFFRLVGQEAVHWQNREHFLGIAAQLMRRIVIDHARARLAAKRGGGVDRVTLDDELEIAAMPATAAAELVELDTALEKLARLSARQAKVVELRYFGGLSAEEAADALEISLATLKRDWGLARAFLHRELAAP